MSIASARAGYANDTSGSRALARPAVAAEVARIQRARIDNELLPLAVDLLKTVLQDDDAAYRDRIRAAEIVVKHATPAADSAVGKELHEMSMAEIERELQRIKAERARLTATDLELVEEQPQGGVFD